VFWSRVLFWVAILSITVLAFLPSTALPEPLSISDKINHFLAFFTLTVALKLAYKISTHRVFIAMFFYGASIEIFQSFTEYRSGDLIDLIVDTIGIIVAILIISIKRVK
jgi:VanZ family protein